MKELRKKHGLCQHSVDNYYKYGKGGRIPKFKFKKKDEEKKIDMEKRYMDEKAVWEDNLYKICRIRGCDNVVKASDIRKFNAAVFEKIKENLKVKPVDEKDTERKPIKAA